MQMMKKNKSLEAVRERERELHFNEVKGITLISLIVTIIVILILARSYNCNFNR